MRGIENTGWQRISYILAEPASKARGKAKKEILKQSDNKQSALLQMLSVLGEKPMLA